MNIDGHIDELRRRAVRLIALCEKNRSKLYQEMLELSLWDIYGIQGQLLYVRENLMKDVDRHLMPQMVIGFFKSFFKEILLAFPCFIYSEAVGLIGLGNHGDKIFKAVLKYADKDFKEAKANKKAVKEILDDLIRQTSNALNEAKSRFSNNYKDNHTEGHSRETVKPRLTRIHDTQAVLMRDNGKVYIPLIYTKTNLSKINELRESGIRVEKKAGATIKIYPNIKGWWELDPQRKQGEQLDNQQLVKEKNLLKVATEVEKTFLSREPNFFNSSRNSRAV